MALLLALARNVPQAYASLVDGRWDRSKYSGVELYEKTLGVLGFGRIGQLVAQRARGFGMRVVAFDPFVSAERFREHGVEKADSPQELYASADFLTIHLPKTPTRWASSTRTRSPPCARGAGPERRPRRPDRRRRAQGRARLGQRRWRGAGRVPQEPVTENPLFGYPNVIVTPHLGASTAEATDRAGYQSAEQVVAALTGGVVSTAVNIPAIAAEDMEALGPFLPLATQLGQLAMTLAAGSSVERIEAAFLGRIAELRHPAARPGGDRRGAAGTHRGAGQRRQRPLDGGPARDRVRGEGDHRGGGLQRADPGDGDRRLGAGGRGRHRDRPQPGSPPGRGPEPPPDDRARATRDRVPLPRPARDDRAGRARSSAPTGSTSPRPPSATRPTAPATRAAWRRWS